MKELEAIEDYIAAVTVFIKKWEEAQVRKDGYRYAFDQTYQRLRFAVKTLGLKENKRLKGLGLPQDDLFSGLSSAASQAAPAPRPTPGFVPAE